jgi:hypothetical protein
VLVLYKRHPEKPRFEGVVGEGKKKVKKGTGDRPPVTGARTRGR